MLARKPIVLAALLAMSCAQADPGSGARAIYDASTGIPGVLVRSEGGPATGDVDVDTAYDSLGTWRTFMLDLYGRNSYDGNGAALQAAVHGSQSSEGFSNGQIVLADGDGMNLGSAARSPDLLYGLLTDALIEATAGLLDAGEPGAVRIAIRDDFAAVGDAYAALSGGTQDPWLIGESLVLAPGGFVRNLANPTADNYSIDHYSHYPQQTEIHGAAGIVNQAFYLLSQGGDNATSGVHLANGIGVFAAGQLWYDALTHYASAMTSMKGWYTAVLAAAVARYGSGSTEAGVVQLAFHAVGLAPSPPAAPPPNAERLIPGTPIQIGGAVNSDRFWVVFVPAGAALHLALDAGRLATGSPRLSVESGRIASSGSVLHQSADVPAARVDRNISVEVASRVAYEQWRLAATLGQR